MGTIKKDIPIPDVKACVSHEGLSPFNQGLPMSKLFLSTANGYTSKGAGFVLDYYLVGGYH